MNSDSTLKYESEKKENELVITQFTRPATPAEIQAYEKIRQERFQMYAINFTLLILALAVGFLFFRRKRKKAKGIKKE